MGPRKQIALAQECETQSPVVVNFYEQGDILIKQGSDLVYLSSLQRASLIQVLEADRG